MSHEHTQCDSTLNEASESTKNEHIYPPIDFAGGDSRFSRIPCIRLIKAKTFKRFFLIRFLIVCSLSLIIQRDAMDRKVLAKRISFPTDWSTMLLLLLSPAEYHLCIRAAVCASIDRNTLCVIRIVVGIWVKVATDYADNSTYK